MQKQLESVKALAFRHWKIRSVLSSSSQLPRSILVAFAVLLAVIYIAVAVHTPLSILPTVVHDDGWYIATGRSLADGEWLGTFNQFTLMRGPGYPAFLA